MSKAKDISEIISDANFGGTLDVDGTTNLDVVDIDGTVTVGSNTSDLRFNINSANQYPLKFFLAGNIGGYIGGGGADILRFSNVAGATTMEMNAGQITMPLQPAFLVRAATTQSNLSSGTVVVFGAEVFDVGANFSKSGGLANAFTAPVAGKYQLNVTMRVDNLDQAATYSRFYLKTSNRNYESIFALGGLSGDPAYWTMTIAVLADMDASDTAFVEYNQSGGSNQADLQPNEQSFSGYLVA